MNSLNSTENEYIVDYVTSNTTGLVTPFIDGLPNVAGSIVIKGSDSVYYDLKSKQTSVSYPVIINGRVSLRDSEKFSSLIVDKEYFPNTYISTTVSLDIFEQVEVENLTFGIRNEFLSFPRVTNGGPNGNGYYGKLTITGNPPGYLQVYCYTEHIDEGGDVLVEVTNSVDNPNDFSFHPVKEDRTEDDRFSYTEQKSNNGKTYSLKKNILHYRVSYEDASNQEVTQEFYTWSSALKYMNDLNSSENDYKIRYINAEDNLAPGIGNLPTTAKSVTLSSKTENLSVSLSYVDKISYPLIIENDTRFEYYNCEGGTGTINGNLEISALTVKGKNTCVLLYGNNLTVGDLTMEDNSCFAFFRNASHNNHDSRMSISKSLKGTLRIASLQEEYQVDDVIITAADAVSLTAAQIDTSLTKFDVELSNDGSGATSVVLTDGDADAKPFRVHYGNTSEKFATWADALSHMNSLNSNDNDYEIVYVNPTSIATDTTLTGLPEKANSVTIGGNTAVTYWLENPSAGEQMVIGYPVTISGSVGMKCPVKFDSLTLESGAYVPSAYSIEARLLTIKGDMQSFDMACDVYYGTTGELLCRSSSFVTVTEKLTGKIRVAFMTDDFERGYRTDGNIILFAPADVTEDQILVPKIDGYTEELQTNPDGTKSLVIKKVASNQSQFEAPYDLDWDGYHPTYKVPDSVESGTVKFYLYKEGTTEYLDYNTHEITQNMQRSISEYYPPYYIMDTGSYYFSVVIEPKANDATHTASDEKTSDPKYYQKPSTSMATTKAAWNGSNGTVSFPAVEGAPGYHVYLYQVDPNDPDTLPEGVIGKRLLFARDVKDGVVTADLTSSLRLAGSYRVRVCTWSEDITDKAHAWGELSDVFEYDGSGFLNDLEELKKAPKNVQWDGYTATWTNDDRIEFYWLDLKNGEEEINPVWLYSERKNGIYRQPLSNAFDESGDYSFRAYATWGYSSGTSGESVRLSDAEKSDWVTVHYDRPSDELGSPTITLDSKPGKMTFTTVPGAAGYEISLRQSNSRYSENVISNYTPWNDMIDMEDDGEGVWWANAEKTAVVVDFTIYNNFDPTDGTFWWRVRAISDDIDTLANGRNVEKIIGVEDAPTWNITYMDGNTPFIGLNPSTYVEGKGATLPKPSNKTGYVFRGWYENSDLTGTAVTAITAQDTGDKTYYAKWDVAKKFIITYMDGKTALTDLTPVEYTEGTATTLPTPAAKEGFAFKGWCEKEDLSDTAVTTIAAEVTGDKTFYAKWAAVHKITYMDGETALTDLTPATYEEGTEPELPKPAAKEGFTFGGWYAAKELTGDAVTKVPAGSKADLAFYAKWTPDEPEVKKFTVTFNTNGGSAVEAQTVEEGKTATKPADPTKENSRFGGWYADASFTKAYDFAAAVTADTTVYAKWYTRGLSIDAIADQVYTGGAITPAVKVYDGMDLLREKTDYTVSYKNNTNVGTATATVTGKGDYSSKKEVTFKIVPLSIEGDRFSVSVPWYGYTGSSVTPEPMVKFNGKVLKKGTDYEVVAGSYVEEGEYTFTIKGTGNFTGERKAGFGITKATLITDKKVTVTVAKSVKYTGQPLQPQMTVKYNGSALTEGTDYTVSYRDNVDAGTGVAILTGKGENYAGVREVTFKIAGTPISKAKVNNLQKLSYTGEPLKQSGITVDYKGTTLKEGQDYTVSYLKNVEVGSATIVLTGRGGYTGTLKKSFKIEAYDISTNTGSKFKAALEKASYPYTKGGTTPQPKVTFNGEVLREKLDYTLSYSDNKKAGTAKVTIKGKGRFKGSVSLSFTVAQQNIGDVFMTVPDIKFSKGKYVSKPVLIDENGKKLTAGTDYEKTVEYKTEDGKVLGKSDTVTAGAVIIATVTGKGQYTGTKSVSYRVTEKAFSPKNLKIAAQEYTGDPVTVKPSDVTAKDMVYGKDFEIVEGSYTNNVKKGKASVIIRGLGEYGGQKTVKFSITAKKIDQ